MTYRTLETMRDSVSKDKSELMVFKNDLGKIIEIAGLVNIEIPNLTNESLKMLENSIQNTLDDIDRKKFLVPKDLALSNLIFSPDGEVNIIDWEHFHIADGSFYGFDIIHLLFLTVYKRIDRLKSSEKQFLRECYKDLCDKVPSDNKILARPFINSKKYLNEYSHNFSLNIPIKDKFTLASFCSKKLEKLDIIIS